MDYVLGQILMCVWAVKTFLKCWHIKSLRAIKIWQQKRKLQLDKKLLHIYSLNLNGCSQVILLEINFQTKWVM